MAMQWRRGAYDYAAESMYWHSAAMKLESLKIEAGAGTGSAISPVPAHVSLAAIAASPSRLSVSSTNSGSFLIALLSIGDGQLIWQWLRRRDEARVLASICHATLESFVRFKRWPAQFNMVPTRVFGTAGAGPGNFHHPCHMALFTDATGRELLAVAEHGNRRVQARGRKRAYAGVIVLLFAFIARMNQQLDWFKNLYCVASLHVCTDSDCSTA
jgi:hypothetical protein